MEYTDEWKQVQPYYADRKHGILTPTLRKHLYGEDEPPTDATVRKRDERIKNRVRSAILDFRLLQEQLSADEKREIFNPRVDTGTDSATRADEVPNLHHTKYNKTPVGFVSGCATDMIAFIFHYAFSEHGLEREVKEGIELTLRQEGWIGNVHVNIDIELKETHEEALERLKEHGVTGHNPDRVTNTTLRELNRAGALSDEEYKKYRQKWRDGRNRKLRAVLSDEPPEDLGLFGDLPDRKDPNADGGGS